MASETKDIAEDQDASVPARLTGDGQPAGGAPDATYQPPTLVYVGNVHALLAGTGPSPTSDGNKNSNSRT